MQDQDGIGLGEHHIHVIEKLITDQNVHKSYATIMFLKLMIILICFLKDVIKYEDIKYNFILFDVVRWFVLHNLEVKQNINIFCY